MVTRTYVVRIGTLYANDQMTLDAGDSAHVFPDYAQARVAYTHFSDEKEKEIVEISTALTHDPDCFLVVSTRTVDEHRPGGGTQACSS